MKNAGKPQWANSKMSFLYEELLKYKEMAKGKLCPQCKKIIMYALEEKYYPACTEVIYYCKPCNFKEKVFEDK